MNICCKDAQILIIVISADNDSADLINISILSEFD